QDYRRQRSTVDGGDRAHLSLSRRGRARPDQGEQREGQGGGEEMMGTAVRTATLLVASAVILALAGCGEQEELTQWMEQQKREVKPNVQPLSPPKKFVPEPYIALNGVEPFSAQ